MGLHMKIVTTNNFYYPRGGSELVPLDKKRFSKVRHSLAKQFRNDHSQRDQLCIVLCVTKGPIKSNSM